jgi:predicted aldo/keto reductase-like oxidoreductase
MKTMSRSLGIDRREFLRRSAFTGLGVGLFPLASSVEARGEDQPRIRRSVRLGDTELEVSDIGFGASRLLEGEDLVRYALDRGITYFDTAEGYAGGRSEPTLGRALRGQRHRVTIATKVKAQADSTRAGLMEALEQSLRLLQTDYVDVYFNHAVNDVARLENPEWSEFMRLAKEQGKVRYSGMSGHAGRLVECVEYALDHDLADVFLLAMNFGQDPRFFERFTGRLDWIARQPELHRVLTRAREKGAAVIGMKTLRGGRLNDLRAFETEGSTFAQAAFRWVLSHPDVDSLVVTMKTPAMIDEYLGASGWTRLADADLSLLERYEVLNGATQCRYGCSACADSCPSGVPISDVLRVRMYGEDYGERGLARSEYALLGAGASPCPDCTDRSCARACPHGVRIAELTERTHRTLG